MCVSVGEGGEGGGFGGETYQAVCRARLPVLASFFLPILCLYVLLVCLLLCLYVSEFNQMIFNSIANHGMPTVYTLDMYFDHLRKSFQVSQLAEILDSLIFYGLLIK